MRPGCIAAFALLLVGLAIGLALGVRSLAGGGGIDLGSVEDYALASVVYHSTDGLFVVRLPDGALIALSDADPRGLADGEGCRVTFRPDLAGADGHGRFFDICSGALYDIGGRALAGGPALRRLPLRVDGDGGIELAE